MDAPAAQRELIERVAHALAAAGERVERFETHISWVLVAGRHAYKFKKALKLPFLDCSALAARRFYCEEECRLNRRLAPALYIDTVAVAATPAGPALGGTGEPLDYAVRMHAFDQGALWSLRLAAGTLDASEVDRLSALLARFHAAAPRAPPGSAWGAPEGVAENVLASFDALAAELADPVDAAARSGAAALAALRRWEARERAALGAAFAGRKQTGMVRECHGDLHCGNVLTWDGEVQAFDCIEFDQGLRWIDVMDDLAFIHMDLAFHGRAALAARLLSRYLECSGDYGGLALLRYYRVHRALVRAKLMLLRARQLDGSAGREACRREGLDYLGFARRCARRPPGALVAMHGFSGSGKSTVARMLVELLGAVQLRSDVERKRLPGATPGQDLYGDSATRATYERLAVLAREVLAAGWPVVVDAACLAARQRARLRAVAEGVGVPFLILDLRAESATMLARIAARRAAGGDPSDADAAVLARQMAGAEPLSRRERAHAIVIDAGAGLAELRAACEVVGKRLARRACEPGLFQAAHIDAAHRPAHPSS